jgi:hypothetical protein
MASSGGSTVSAMPGCVRLAALGAVAPMMAAVWPSSVSSVYGWMGSWSAGPSFSWGQDHTLARNPGDQATYVHGLYNTGSVTDTYTLDWGSLQGWAVVLARANGITYTLPGVITLPPGQAAFVYVTVTVPHTSTVRGSIDIAHVIVAAGLGPDSPAVVTDMTLVPVAPVYLPLVARQQQ